MTELVHQDGRVAGVAATRGGKPIRIRARKGVVLARAIAANPAAKTIDVTSPHVAVVG